jgi:hypothetical protein
MFLDLMVNGKLGWLNNVSGVFLVFFPCSYWSAGFGTFLQAQTLASHWLEDFASCVQMTVDNYQYNATHST